jgi:glycosyltransferase involved in cell wall biosynthesis
MHRVIRSYGLVDVFLAPSYFLIEKFRAAGFQYPIQKVVQPIRPFPQSPESSQRDSLLYIGRLAEEKGVATLLEACRQLQGAINVKIIGTGPEESRLREQAQNIAGVEFLGYQTGPVWEQALRGARALIMPSIWYENMPYVVLEALSRGTPVIASRLGGVPERITEGVNGFLFQPGDAADLVRAIQKLRLIPDPLRFSQAVYESVGDARPEAYYQTLLAVYAGGLPHNHPPAY